MRIVWDEALILGTVLPVIALGFINSESGIVLLMVVAIATAIYNTYSSTLRYKLYSYIWQSAALVPLAGLRFVETADGWFIGVALFLAARVFVIPYLMARATVSRDAVVGDKVPLANPPGQQPRGWLTEARGYWLTYGETRMGSVLSLVVSAAFIGLAYLVALRTQLPSLAQEDRVALGAAISLLLIGLFAMINEQQLPSQVVGLLIMENGLFLAAAIFITNSYFLVSFWFSMATFFFITFFILARFVPAVQSISGSAQIDDQRKLSESPDAP